MYMLYYLPGSYLTVINDGQRRFFNSLGLSKVPFKIYMLGNCAQFGFNYFLITKCQMGIRGAGIGTGLSNAFIFILMNSYALCEKSISPAITRPDS